MTIKYTFTMTDDESNFSGPAREVIHSITGEQSWVELLPLFEEWLRGVGYHFDGHLEMVTDKGEIS